MARSRLIQPLLRLALWALIATALMLALPQPADAQAVTLDLGDETSLTARAATDRADYRA